MKQLTKAQQELVSKNHNLIYSFAQQKKLALDDYYDLLAIGLCKAAKIFDKNKGEFSSVAYECMYNEVKMYWGYISKKTSVPEEMILHYDQVSLGIDHAHSDEGDNSGSNILYYLADTTSVYDIVADNTMLEILINLLTEKEKIVVQFLMQGFTHKEIAAMMNCKRQNITYFVAQIRKKFTHYFNNN